MSLLRLSLPHALVLGGLVGSLAAGCSCETAPPVPSDIGPRDVGMRDVPEPLDTPAMDVPLGDGEIPDVPVDAGPPTCSVGDVLELATDTTMRERIVGLAAGPASWAVTWAQDAEGPDEVYVATIAATGDPSVSPLTALGAIQRDPSVARIDGGWLVAWSGNHLDANFEIYAQSVGEDLSPVGAPSRLTTNADLDAAPVLVALPTSGMLAAWVEGGASANLAVTRVLADTGVPSAAARTVTTASFSVERPTLAQRSAGAVMVWGEAAADPPATRALALDAAGAASGTAATASTEGNVDGSADVTMDALGGAMVFGALVGGVRPEVRLRRLDATGSPIESESVATTSSGRDASIAPFGGGYVVSYRASGASTPIRLAFLDSQGMFLDEIDLAVAEGTGGRTTVRVTEDGRILVAWADTTGAGTRIRAARVRCE